MRSVARLRFAPRPPTVSRRGFDEGRDEDLGVGGDRDGQLYVPDTAEAGAPVLVFLHGAGGSGRRQTERHRALRRRADDHGAEPCDDHQEDSPAQTSPADQVAVFTFDRQLTPLVTFEQWTAAPSGERVALAT